MLRILWFALLFASPVFAQDDSAAKAVEAAGCGPADVKFEVKTDKKQHPTAQPEAGKALVYVIGDTWSDHAAVHIGTAPARFGIDGKWVGANGYRSYFFFSVEPGDHRLCTNFQAPLERVVKASTTATSFTAEAGKSYYFRTITPEAGSSDGPIEIVPVDPAEAQVLMASTAFSTFQLKK